MITAPTDVKQIDPSAKDDGIQLPFTAPILYWRNGKRELQPTGGVSHFGGWDGNDDEVEAAVNEFDSLPKGFYAESRFGKTDGEYAVYSSRTLLIAPIVQRRRWKDNRSHVQALCLIGGSNEDGSISEWGTAVVSVKGKSATIGLSDAIKKWASHSKEARTSWAMSASGPMPSWYFWQAVGTFGDFNAVTMKGKNGKESTVTPILPYLPEIKTAEQLEKLYVGNDSYRKMSEFAEQAEEWANDKRWLDGNEQLIQQAPAPLPGQEHLAVDYNKPLPPIDSEEFPF